MGGGSIMGTCAVALAGCGGAALGSWAWRQGRMRVDGVTRLDLVPRERMVMLMHSAARPFYGAATQALRISAVQEMADEALGLLQAEHRLDAAGFVAVLMGASVMAGIISFGLSLSPAFAVAAACLCFAGAWLFVRRRSERAASAMRDEVPAALRSLADSFRSGHSLLQTMRQASADLDGGLSDAFGRVANRLETGEGTTEALAELRQVKGVPELAFVAVALDVQHQSGGSIAPVLESARASVESELELARSLRVQTAQAKLSASIVTLMPFVLVALFSLVSPGFLSPFFESAVGIVMLLAALAMQVAGVLSVRRICRVSA